ncbi:MAG: hypothetical protein AAGU76_07510 [Sedimentibacter sp.]|uniref:YkvI family membrane protein n=1 Tax=Sedimentibacter sp. TaxID=1960295 RepID=UPI0031585919
MVSKNDVTTLKVAATYIGTIVGAGFATGQEVLQFFTRFGAMGIAGLIATTIMFIVFGYIIMDLGKSLNARSHLEIIRYSGGSILGSAIDAIITFFLFGAFTAMIAGTGALFVQQFNLPGMLGSILMAVITALTVLTGINGVINSISFVVPFLLAAVIGTSVFSILSSPPDITATVSGMGESGLITNWFMAAVLYVSYNTIVSVAVLGPLGAEARDRKSVRNGAILGGLGLGLGSVMIYLALSGNIAEVSRYEVPMIHVAGRISYTVQIFYAVVLTAEVYTTSVGAMYGFVSRITDMKKHPARSRMIVAVSTVAGLAASSFGFSNLVKYLYPVVGYGGIILLISLIYVKIINKKTA